MINLLAQLVLIFGPNVHNVTENSATIVYETPQICDSKLHYFNGRSFDFVNSRNTDIHNMALNHLAADTIYHYAIEVNNQWSPIYAFKTIDSKSSIRFGIWGDNQIQDNIFRQVTLGFLRNGCEYWIGVGDYVQNMELRQEWITKFDLPMLGLSRFLPIIGCRGNHDGETDYAHKYFPVPNGAQWGSVTVGSVRFAILDTNQNTFELRTSLIPNGEQRNWLLNEINSPAWKNAKFRVAIYHHPHATNFWDGGCYYGEYGSGIEPILFDIVNNVLVPAGVDLILNGHSHSYFHGKIGSTHHIITGGAGGWLDATECWRQPNTISSGSFHHYLTMDINKYRLHIRCVKLDGSVFEEFSIKGKKE